jgi:hypothetical protein
MHAHHSDGSVAAAVFADGTYFVDTPHTSIILYLMLCYMATDSTAE